MREVTYNMCTDASTQTNIQISFIRRSILENLSHLGASYYHHVYQPAYNKASKDVAAVINHGARTSSTMASSYYVLQHWRGGVLDLELEESGTSRKGATPFPPL